MPHRLKVQAQEQRKQDCARTGLPRRARCPLPTSLLPVKRGLGQDVLGKGSYKHPGKCKEASERDSGWPLIQGHFAPIPTWNASPGSRTRILLAEYRAGIGHPWRPAWRRRVGCLHSEELATLSWFGGTSLSSSSSPWSPSASFSSFLTRPSSSSFSLWRQGSRKPGLVRTSSAPGLLRFSRHLRVLHSLSFPLYRRGAEAQTGQDPCRRPLVSCRRPNSALNTWPSWLPEAQNCSCVDRRRGGWVDGWLA